MSPVISGVLSVILCLVVAGEARNGNCQMSFDKARTMLTLNLETAEIIKPGLPGPAGPPGVVPADVTKTLEDKIAALEKDVEALKKKVGIVDEKNKTEEGTYFKGRHKYWISPGTHTWANAKKFCTEKGGQLASKGVREVRGQKEIINALFPVGGIAWIGIDDIADEGKWMWNDGVEATSDNTAWYPGEPNNVGGGQDCGSIRYGLDGIDDDSCSAYHQALCSNV